MNNPKDIRWRQRFENFSKALEHLREALALKNPSELERAGAIQFFEIVFELGWKTMQDYLKDLGYNQKGPRPVIKKAFEIEIINKGDVWLKMLNDRNASAHLYDEEEIEAILVKIRETYLPVLEELKKVLSKL